MEGERERERMCEYSTDPVAVAMDVEIFSCSAGWFTSTPINIAFASLTLSPIVAQSTA